MAIIKTAKYLIGTNSSISPTRKKTKFQGYANVEPNAHKILSRLEEEDGFLPLHDKSSPDAIKDLLEMSKKTFKKAIGGLYKQQLIEIKEEGIFLK